jgi:hypothetical protein
MRFISLSGFGVRGRKVVGGGSSRWLRWVCWMEAGSCRWSEAGAPASSFASQCCLPGGRADVPRRCGLRLQSPSLGWLPSNPRDTLLDQPKQTLDQLNSSQANQQRVFYFHPKFCTDHGSRAIRKQRRGRGGPDSGWASGKTSHTHTYSHSPGVC